MEHILTMDATPLPSGMSTNGIETTQAVVAMTAGLILRNPLSVSIGAGIG